MVWKFLGSCLLVLSGFGGGYFFGHSDGYQDAYVDYRIGLATGRAQAAITPPVASSLSQRPDSNSPGG